MILGSWFHDSRFLIQTAHDPATLEIGLVEARELEAPAGATPVHWRLLTTLPATTKADAEEVVRLYRLRWRIEQVFRALKSDGLALEETQLEDAGHILWKACAPRAAWVPIAPGYADAGAGSGKFEHTRVDNTRTKREHDSPLDSTLRT